MTDKVTLTSLASLENENTAINQINGNSVAIVAGFDNTLSRDGTSPNQMGANLDMNSNQILNLPAPATVNSPARLQDVVTNPTINVPPVGTSGAVVPLLNANNTWSGAQTFSNTSSVFNGQVPFVQNGSGAVSRTTVSKLQDFYSVKDFGATGNGSTDDTSAINTAIAAVPSGGTLYFPEGTYLCTASSTHVFPIGKAINIHGAGMFGTSFLVKTGTGSTVDIFHVNPAAGISISGIDWRNFSIIYQAGTYINNKGINLDTTAATNCEISYVLMENIYVGYGMTLNFTNRSDNATGGTFLTTFQNGFISGGVVFLYAGDTLRFLNNEIYGFGVTNNNFSGNQISGAGNIQIIGNNIGVYGGAAIALTSATNPIIAFNEIEVQGTITEANNAVIDLQGTIIAIDAATITGNQVQSGASLGNPTLIRIDHASGVQVSSNRFGVGADWPAVVLTSNAAHCTVSNNDFTGTFTTGITNSSATSTLSGNIGVNPVGIAGPTTVGTSPATITNGGTRSTYYVNQSATNTGTISIGGSVVGTLKTAGLPMTVDLGPNESMVVTWTTTAPTYYSYTH